MLFDVTAWGPSSGSCGHRHRTETAARRCLGSDRRLFSVSSDDPIDPPPGATRMRGVAPFQETYAESPWRLLVACILSNRTDGRVAQRTADAVFDRWPEPAHLAAADPERVADLIRPVGMQNRKARMIVTLSHEIATYTAMRTRSDRIVWPPPVTYVAGLTGVGNYALDSYRIFVLGDRDVDTDDPELSAYLAREDL